MKRYLAVIELYINAEDDCQANDISQKLTTSIRKDLDTLCYTKALYHIPKGKEKMRLVNGDESAIMSVRS